MTRPTGDSRTEPEPRVESWQPAPLEPSLDGCEVAVWRADMRRILALLGGEQAATTLLDRDERDRAARRPTAEQRSLWIASRAALRVLLGRYLAVEPATLAFRSEQHGKPVLVTNIDTTSGPAAPAGPLSFNLSHSGSSALFAFSRLSEVGVDIELARRPIDHVALAERVLGPAQAERLRGLDEREREREYLRAWTRREAELKCLGTGFPGTETVAQSSAMWIAELPLGSFTGVQAAAAVAVARTPEKCSCWDWPDGLGHDQLRRR